MNVNKTYCVIQWKEIYPLDSVIYPSKTGVRKIYVTVNVYSSNLKDKTLWFYFWTGVWSPDDRRRLYDLLSSTGSRVWATGSGTLAQTRAIKSAFLYYVLVISKQGVKKYALWLHWEPVNYGALIFDMRTLLTLKIFTSQTLHMACLTNGSFIA